MDEVSYTYDSNRNTLRMVKMLAVTDQRPKTAKSAPRERIAVSSPSSNIGVITLRDRFDGDVSGDVEHILNKQLTAGNKFLVLDLAEVDYISSNGLKTVVTICRRAREANGDLVLSGLRPRVQEILEITGLDMIVTVYRTSADAIASIPSE
jgi:anti-anti-sigma factor